jgi:hypothetical protein
MTTIVTRAGKGSALTHTEMDTNFTNLNTAKLEAADIAGKADVSHTQTASTITDFNSATRAQVEAELIAGSNVTITPGSTGATRTLTIAASGGAGATNLTTTAAPTTVTINSDTGTDAVIAAADGTNAGLFLPAEKTKLTGIASGATANSADATLLARANHTGTQASTTISDFNSAARAQVEAELIAGTNVTITPGSSGATRTLTIAATGGSSAFPAVEAIATGSAYTLVTGDANKIKVAQDASAQTINITTAFNGLGCWIQWNAAAGTVTLDANAGVNLNGLGDGVNIVLSQAAGMIQIIPTGTNTWNVVGAIGDLAVADITDMSANARTFNQAADYAAMRTALTAASRSQTSQFSFFIPTVADGDVVVIPMQAFAGTVTQVTTDCTSGTCTLTGKVNTTNFGGTANSVSTTKTSQAHASANTWTTGDDLVFTASSNASCLGMRVTVTYTRTLA